MAGWHADLCIYHGNCDDGFGAAWAIWKRWPRCEFVAGAYGKPLPDVTGKNVLFVDFSAPYARIVECSFKARSIVIIDHHKTAQADLERLPPFDGMMDDLQGAFAINRTQNTPDIAVWFDMNQSGATMAWQFATQTHRQDCGTPTMLAYIEDRDLWRFAYGERTRQFSAALRTYPMDFETWDRIAEDTDPLLAEGAVVLRAHRANVEKILREAYLHEIGGHQVPVVNAPYHYASDAAHELLSRYPAAPFAAAWFRRADGRVQWSLRSEDHRVDVSAVAVTRGGGGHRNAAGFDEAA